VLFSVEELAVNELRETFHHWVRTLAFPVSGGQLGEPLPHASALDLRGGKMIVEKAGHDAARMIVEDIEPDLKRRIAAHAMDLTRALAAQLDEAGKAARAEEEQRYRSRQAEVSTLISENTLAKLEREIAALKAARNQGALFDAEQRLDAIDRSIEEKRAEIERRTRHYTEVRDQLERERERVLKYLLPKRHAMQGQAQVFPVSIEIRLPGDA
jgi:hypothetical protein